MERPLVLIGMFDSPFVRRVAVSMVLLGFPFEHRDWSVGRDFERIREINPLGRVPVVVLPGGEVLLESSVILEFLDQAASAAAGADRGLLPAAGPARRAALRLMAIATGAAEKGLLQIYERVFRPEEKRHEPWLGRCRTQMHGALTELERSSAARPDEWLVGDAMTQADITVACMVTFLSEALKVDPGGDIYPTLAGLNRRCEALPAFQTIRANFSPP